ncbi:SGNH/GDSL hydrolase family protein [Lacticigenium naphthae]|uniref:SGNH/GDSL hydrolase family protein n=1 Tax=Lacticigenium naphthae TaxID=515351 RepID=UPI00048024F3|nr:SGNH/GDSL hydrolase family protein [Lacticigenium naphthae]
MRSIKSAFIASLVVTFSAVFIFFLLSLLPLSNNSNEAKEKTQDSQMYRRMNLNFVAIGDSLTQGTGDGTYRGGYIPIVASRLEESGNIEKVYTSNFGKKGDELQDLLEKKQTQEEMQTKITQADIVSVTIGGNDLVAAFRKSNLKGTEAEYAEVIKKFSRNLEQLIVELKVMNEDAQLYVYGLYNPYYFYFSDIQPMQNIVNSWNEETARVIEEHEQVTFVPIDNLINGVELPTDSTEEEFVHPYLYTEDLFHPNEHGYQLMADALYEAIIANNPEFIETE